MHQVDGFQQKLLQKAYFTFKLIGRPMVRKEPLVSHIVRRELKGAVSQILSKFIKILTVGTANKLSKT